MRYILKHNF